MSEPNNTIEAMIAEMGGTKTYEPRVSALSVAARILSAQYRRHPNTASGGSDSACVALADETPLALTTVTTKTGLTLILFRVEGENGKATGIQRTLEHKEMEK